MKMTLARCALLIGTLVGVLAANASTASACTSHPPNPPWEYNCKTVTNAAGNQYTQCTVTICGTVVASANQQSTCACGLSAGAGLAVTAVSAIDPSTGLPTPGFNGFNANAATTTAFTKLAAPPTGAKWYGFNSTIGALPTGRASCLRYTVAASTVIPPSQYPALVGKQLAGTAEADTTGGKFTNPEHQSVTQLPATGTDCSVVVVDPTDTARVACAAPSPAATDETGEATDEAASGCSVTSGRGAGNGALAFLLIVLGARALRRRRA